MAVFLQEIGLDGLENEVLVQAIWRINSLRRSLAIMALTWASCLHDPSTFVNRQQAQSAKDLGRAASVASLASAPVGLQEVPRYHMIHLRYFFCLDRAGQLPVLRGCTIQFPDVEHVRVSGICTSMVEGLEMLLCRA